MGVIMRYHETQMDGPSQQTQIISYHEAQVLREVMALSPDTILYHEKQTIYHETQVLRGDGDPSQKTQFYTMRHETQIMLYHET
eukprot:14635882-Ditylum_brightwellii.AAC.1